MALVRRATLIPALVAAFVLAFPSASRADNITTFSVSGTFGPYSWYFDPSSTVTINTTAGTVVGSYLVVNNTPNGIGGNPFIGLPTSVSTYYGPCIAGAPQTCWTQYIAQWVSGNNRVVLSWKSSGSVSNPPPAIIGFTGGSIVDAYAYIGYPYLNWGSTATLTPVVPVATPEPSSLLLLGSGLAGLWLKRRKGFDGLRPKRRKTRL